MGTSYMQQVEKDLESDIRRAIDNVARSCLSRISEREWCELLASVLDGFVTGVEMRIEELKRDDE